MSNEQELIAKSNNAWKTLAAWWDNDIEDGDPYHRCLIFPHVLSLLDIKPHQKILDLACGNGALSRKMAALGADVLGVDISDVFINKAIERSGEGIRYQQLDATSSEELSHLAKEEQFDAVVCSMALHDLPTIEPLLQSLSHLLKPQGSFIFTVPHPCFNSGEVRLNFFDERPSITRSNYIKPMHLEMNSKPNQPVKQHCFHRSLTDIFGQLFSINMVLDGLKEPAMCDVLEETELDWKLLSEIPPALICRWIFKK